MKKIKVQYYLITVVSSTFIEYNFSGFPVTCIPIHRVKCSSADISFSRLWCNLVYIIMRSLWIACYRKTTEKESSNLNWLWPNRYTVTVRFSSLYHLILELQVSLIHSPVFHSMWLVAKQLEVYLLKKNNNSHVAGY